MRNLILTLFLLLGTAVSTAGTPTTQLTETDAIRWDSSLSLPQLDGTPNIGIAGVFSGRIGGKLLIAGGANFPDRTPEANGEKRYHRDLYIYDPSGSWQVIRDALPEPRAYGISVTLPEGVLCIGGMYLLCAPKGMSGLYLGDVLELICAVCFTAQILLVGKYADLDGVSLSCVQFAVCGALSLIGALIFEDTRLSDLADAWLPVIYAGVFSSGIGYTLQIIGQKYAEPAVASIIMSLESVFAALAGWLILHERLGGQELLGCALVFIAVLLAQTPELLRRRA